MGSTLAQFLWQGYSEALTQTTTQVINNILQAVVPWVQAGMGLYVILRGKRMLTNATSFDMEVTAVVCAIMVVFFLTPANFNQYITTTATQTIPNAVASAVNGQNNLAGAQGFDALLNAITRFGAQIDAQAVGIEYIAERITVWFAQGTAGLMVMACLFVWMLAQAAIAFIVPIGAFVVPFYLFDATREFAMRWVGKLVALFLVLGVSLILGAFVVKLDAQYMQQFAQTIAANPPDQGFQMNAGDISFTGFSEVGAVGGPGTAPQALAQTSANVAASVNALWNVALVCAFGFFILGIMVGIALYVGGSSGFSVSGPMSAVANVLTAGAIKAIRRNTRR
jgi:TrbL/VirB6 plasmid conjugal transfer protein